MLRLPKKLHRTINQIADDQRRPFNDVIIERLELASTEIMLPNLVRHRLADVAAGLLRDEVLIALAELRASFRENVVLKETEEAIGRAIATQSEKAMDHALKGLRPAIGRLVREARNGQAARPAAQGRAKIPKRKSKAAARKPARDRGGDAASPGPGRASARSASRN